MPSVEHVDQSRPAAKSRASADIVAALNQSLGETAVTTMLAQNFHWNVTGMAFGSLHTLFQNIYEDHFTAQDDIAERIKALGGHAEGQLAKMLLRAKVKEHDGHADDKTMVATLAAAQRTVAQSLIEAAGIANRSGDTLSEDLCIERGRIHEKFAWLLEAHLG